MNRQEIHVTPRKELTKWTVEDDKFEFRKDRSHHWLQRICFFILRKLKAHSKLMTTVYRYTNLESKDLMGKIDEAIRTVVSLEDHQPQNLVIIMGRSQFYELVQNREVHMAMGWTVPMRIRTPYSERCLDIPVAVVPWIEGFAVVPADTVGPR